MALKDGLAQCLAQHALKPRIYHQELTQARAAKLPGIAQPRISNPIRGTIHAFAFDVRVKTAAAGLRVTIRIDQAA